jgi:DNA polymerase-1
MEQPFLRPEDLTPPLNVTLVKDMEGIELLRVFLSTADVFGLDTETNIEAFFMQRRIRTIQIGNREAQYVIDLLELVGNDFNLLGKIQGDYGALLCAGSPLWVLQKVLRDGLETNRNLKVGHNLTFDYTVLKWCLGIRPWNLHDTMLTEKVIHCGDVNFFQKDFWGLSDCFHRYFGKALDKSERKGFWNPDPLTPEQITYAALDTRVALAVRLKQLPILEKHGLARTAKIENDALPAFADMHMNGILIDKQKWVGLLDGVKATHAANISKLDEFFVPIVGTKAAPNFNLVELENNWRDTVDPVIRAANRKKFQAAQREVKAFYKAVEDGEFEGEAALNYGSSNQVLKVLRKNGFGRLKSTDDRFLKALAGEPIIDALRDYRETGKVLSTYGDEFLKKYIRPEDGRVHSEIVGLGAETGRSSSRKPNVQNILQGEWRSCFICAAKWKMLTIDYNGCELRILAELSDEPVWIEAFNKGWDVHSVGAEMLFGKAWTDAAQPGCAYLAQHAKCSCKGHKTLRGQIKAINFGLAYGMEAKKLAEELGITETEAQKLLDNYRGTFVVVTLYLKKSGQSAMTKFEARTMVGRRRMFKKPTWDAAKEIALERLRKDGRQANELESWHVNRVFKGQLGSIEREGKNTPIQGANADLAKLAMGCGFDASGNPYLWHRLHELDARMVNFIHDEFLVEAKEENAQEVFEVTSECMTRAGSEFVKKVRMEVEGHIQTYWCKD